MNKQKANSILLAIIMFLAALTAAVSMKFFSPEDAWLCSDGQWVRHGNPSAQMPSEGCQ